MKCHKCKKRKGEFYVKVANIIAMQCVSCVYKLNQRHPETVERSYLVPVRHG